MRKKVELIVVIVIICFVVIKILTVGQKACESVSNMATTHYNELETLDNEF